MNQQFASNLWQLLEFRSVCLGETEWSAVLGCTDRAHEGHIPKSDTASLLEAHHVSCAAGCTCGAVVKACIELFYEYRCGYAPTADCLRVLEVRQNTLGASVGLRASVHAPFKCAARASKASIHFHCRPSCVGVRPMGLWVLMQ